MPKNVMKLVKPSPKRGKNAFDLSHRHILGANFGELLPITCIETIPGDYHEIRVADLLRAMPMVTSPFLRAKQHIDFWFVPYTDLYSNFNQFITQKNEYNSNAITPWTNTLPTLDLTVAAQVCGGNSQSPDIHGYSKAKTIFELLGYGDVNIPTSSAHKYVNMWRIAAYNYIWYHEYRQSYYDTGSHGLNDQSKVASLFNLDTFGASGNRQPLNDVNLIRAMFQMRYRTWKKDLFTGLMPSTQFDAVSAIDIDLTHGFSANANRNLFLNNGSLAVSSAFTNRYVSASSGGSNNTLVELPQSTDFNRATLSFDVLALRQAQAIQIWRENALRAGNRVSDNMDAHFGVRPSYERDKRPTFLGSFDAPLNVSDVNATAQIGDGGNQSLGDVAGKGLSSMDSRPIKFNANDFGVIMGIFSLLPEAEYNGNCIDKANMLVDRYDYFSPEMENLGLEGVQGAEFVPLGNSVVSGSIIGYAPRYYVYKQKVDKVFGDFKSGGNLSIWTSPKSDISNLSQSGLVPLSSLYVNPSVYDNNFVAEASSMDIQFLCDFFFDVKSVRPMTVLGLPTA